MEAREGEKEQRFNAPLFASALVFPWNCETVFRMRNVTTSVDDDLYREARIKAAEQGTSISALFRNFLVQLTGREATESEFQRLQREEEELREELRANRIGLNPAHNLSRNELHDRHALR